MQRKDRSRRPSIEGLETRELMSLGWSSLPAQIEAPTGGFTFANAFTRTGNIPVIEDDLSVPQGLSFIAPHSGSYTFTETGTPVTTGPGMNFTAGHRRILHAIMRSDSALTTSTMVPIFAVYNQSGGQIWEGSSGKPTETCTLYLFAGQRYEIVTCNLVGTSFAGPYTVNVTGYIPEVTRKRNYGNDVTATAVASLDSSNDLDVWLYTTNTLWNTQRSQVTVELVTAQGKVLLKWPLPSVKTGPFGHTDNTWTENLGPYKLPGLSSIDLTLN